jgi:hypothetical protein
MKDDPIDIRGDEAEGLRVRNEGEAGKAKKSEGLIKKAKRPAVRSGRPVGRKHLKSEGDVLRGVYAPDRADEVK